MSDKSYRELDRILGRYPVVRRGGGADPESLARLAEEWGPVAPDFECYLRRYGWASVDGWTLLGLGPDVPPEQDLLTRARAMWGGVETRPLPRSLLPVCLAEGGICYAISRARRGEPILRWSLAHEDLSATRGHEIVFSSWTSWFLAVVAGRGGPSW
jgi:hypothetical protein